MSTARRSLADIAKKGVPSPAKLSHVVIRTGSVAKLKNWYLTLLSARVSFENESLCFMTYDDFRSLTRTSANCWRTIDA